MPVCPGYVLLPATYTWVQRAFRIWDPVPPRRQGPGRRGRGLKAPETTRVGETLDPRSVSPFSLSFWVSLAPSSLRLCSWQPSRAGAGALAASRNLPGHFCARGGLWQAERRAKRARQKGGSGLRAALRTSAPPHPRLESQETKSPTRGPVGEGLGGSEALPRALPHGGGIWAGLPSWVQLQVGIRVWM